jgi:hypothetical protein
MIWFTFGIIYRNYKSPIGGLHPIRSNQALYARQSLAARIAPAARNIIGSPVAPAGKKLRQLNKAPTLAVKRHPELPPLRHEEPPPPAGFMISMEGGSAGSGTEGGGADRRPVTGRQSDRACRDCRG